MRFFTGYFHIKDLKKIYSYSPELASKVAEELDRQHNVGLLKGALIGIVCYIIFIVF